MGLFQLTTTAVTNPVGVITQAVNAKKAGAQGSTWAYENDGGVIRYTRSYVNTLRVFTSTPYVGSIQITEFLRGMGAVQGATYFFPLPEYGPPTPGANDYPFPASPTEIDTGSFLHTIDIVQETDDARQWLCTFAYGPRDINHETGGGNQNPLFQVPKVKWTPVIKEVSYSSDINGKPFTNTSGDPFENPPKREQSEQTLSFTRNEATYNEVYAQQYRQSINLNPFLGFAPKQAKCKSITGERIWNSDFGYYWEVNYEFEFRIINILLPVSYNPLTDAVDNSSNALYTFGWEDIVLNTGFREIDNTGKVRQIMDNAGLPITTPMPLGPDGKAYYKSNNPNVASPPPYYKIYDQYPQMPFEVFGIPDDILTSNI